MRKFQHYQLNCDAGLADAARKILEHSGMDKFCLDNETPGEPPLLTPEKIMFANKELVEAGRRCWDVCIMSKKAREEIRARDDQESHDFLYNYGDTNADGCHNEMWMLLIWAMLNGHGDEMHGSYVNGQDDFHDIEDDYEEIFGVKLDGDVLREMCRHHQVYIQVAEMMDDYDIPFTIDDLQASKNLYHSEAGFKNAISSAFNSMLTTIFISEYGNDGDQSDDPFATLNASVAEMRALQNAFADLSQDERVKILTLGAVNLNDFPKDERYEKFYEPTCNLRKLMRDYEELWKMCGDREELNKTHPRVINAIKRKDEAIKKVKSSVSDDDGEGLMRRMEQERATAAGKIAAIMENATLEEIRDSFLNNSGNIGLFEALDDGVPMEDLLA